MNYPKRNHYLIIRKTGKDSYNIKDFLTEEEWEAGVRFIKFLKALDGHTDPYTIDPDLDEEMVECMLDTMEREGLLDSGERILSLGFGSVLIPLWFPEVKRIHRILGAVWNRLLILLWIPLMIMGIHILLNGSWRYIEKGWGTLTGNLLGIGFGLLLHEISHAAACIGYGLDTYFFECGLLLQNFLPGAYVMIDYTNLKNRFKRAQINAAGIECNMALCGLFLCALKLELLDSTALIIAAAWNIMLAIFNTTLIEGLDGMCIFREVLGCENFVEKAKGLIFNKRGKRLLRSRGINGRATIAACYIIVFLQVLWPLILIMNVINIVGLFI